MNIMKKSIIISSVLMLVSVILGCYMLFAEIPEYEYFLIIEAVAVLLFAITVVTLIFRAVLLKTEQSSRVKTGYKFIVLFLIIITVLYIPCAFISCYDEYTPEMQYVNNEEYIQQFLPITDISEIETRDDLLRSMILYTNYPGFSELAVVDMHGFDRYELVYTKSLNPVYNLRSILGIKYTLMTESINGDWISDIYNINGTEVHVYSNSKDMYGYINNYGNIMSVLKHNCREIFTSEEAFAEYISKQYVLADECLSSMCFRDAPWYDVPFYVNALTEPYEDIEYFL